MYLFCSVLFCLFAVSSSSTVLITGASSGFGRVSALDWAAKGYNVAVCARRTDLLASVVQEIQAAGGKAVSAVCDVTKPESLAGAFAAAEQAFGTVDYVFANAGYEGPTSKASSEIDSKEVLRVFEVNVLGSYYTFVEALKSFAKPPQRDTAFVVVGSGAGSVPYAFGTLVATFPGGVAPLSPYPTAYSMSKSAIETLVRVAAGALGNGTTRVVGINPYAFETDMLIKVAESFDLPVAATQGFNPIFKRLGNPRDIAVAVEAIWNNTSGWVHGDIFLIDNDATWSVQENYDKMLKGAFPPTPKRSRVFDVTGTKPYPFAEPEEIYAESIAASLRSQREKTARKEQERKDKETKGAKKAQEKADKAEQKAKKVKQPKGEEKKEQGQAAPQEEL